MHEIRLVSGGQTGADRAALDFAIEHDIPHGGWCPKGRLAEDGPIPERYRLKETTTTAYPQRTEANVRDSDGTVIFTVSAKLGGGSLKTLLLAQKHKKPVLHISREGGPDTPEQELRGFIEENEIRVLNVAGSRASKEPNVGQFVRNLFEVVLLANGRPIADRRVGQVNARRGPVQIT